MIEEYHFGSITIDGKTYNHDVEVLWTPKHRAHKPKHITDYVLGKALCAWPAGQACKVLKWWRKESHIIDVEDMERALAQNPETIVIGTGAFGIAKVTEKAQRLISEKGIKLIEDKTEEAAKTFNIICQDSIEEEGAKERVIGFFHLTC